MKNIQKKMCIVIFILLFLISNTGLCVDIAYSKYVFDNDVNINFSIDGCNFYVDDSIISGVKVTEIQKNNYNISKDKKIEYSTKLLDMGFDSKQTLCYIYPYLYYRLNKILDSEIILSQNATVSVEKNTGNIKFNNSKNGVELDKNYVFDIVLYNLINKIEKNVNFNKKVVYPEVDLNTLKEKVVLKAEFVTNFENSTNERKNNIVLALKSLDGTVINSQNILSFNQIVGERTQNKGYMQAKIIKSGKFVSAIGGGVCQVSTTLYNASLLAGLEIIEVHPHSLRINYIEPGFDAMVNAGSSDLKIKNNTDEQIIIATSSINDECKIKIYGVKNDRKYLRKYEESDYESEVLDNQTLIKKGSMAKASLLIYENNKFIEEKFLREVRYKPLIKTDSDEIP